MARLRDPDGGCPWDLEQTFATIAPYTIEEAYEVADAITRADMASLRDELGDLLFQVLFHARMAEEAGAFDLASVAEALVEKMTRRHPHVFAQAEIATAGAQTENWETIKAAERAARVHADGSILADVPLALPALLRAEKLTKRAARVGFDWPDPEAVLAKLDEEIAETREALGENDPAHVAEEIGDMLFVLANLARKAGVDPEAALRGANAKFERRFRSIEAALAADGRGPADSNLAEMETLWTAAKAAERA
jgi:tetrapyrrole methylase family protein/MazG family protein/ATP diphosphatase